MKLNKASLFALIAVLELAADPEKQLSTTDIAQKHANYWRWTKPDSKGRYPYRNQIPAEIVEIFEKHGFIWGGRWYHYDTMHFEYRPELLK